MMPAVAAQAARELRVGWCPGVLRPMPAGDGLLARIKPRGQRLSLRQARGIAALAERFGNGALNLTARGNLQMRGLDEAGLPALTAALGALGLLDGSAEGEAVRNVLSSSLSGADPEALVGLGPMVAILEDRLANDKALWRLPPKFAWLVDERGCFGLDDLMADVRFEALAGPDGDRLAVMLDGDATRALCRPGDLVDVATRLATTFLALCGRFSLVPHRMRDLVAACGAHIIFREAGLSEDGEAVTPRLGPRVPAIGCHRQGPWSFVGAAPAFGTLATADFERIAVLAAEAGAHELRLTPWRSLVIAGLTEAAAEQLARALSAAQLIVDPADPCLAITACVGQPACHRATTPVPADAARLAAALPRGRRLHVSGCAKGCAHPAPAEVTLVGRGGRYDLVRAGRASNPPLAASLSLDTAMAMLRELPA